MGRISQTNRLEKILVENNILQADGSFVKAVGLDEETKGEISDKLQYLEYNYEYKNVDYLPDGFTMSDMESLLGFSYTYYYRDFPSKDNGTYISINDETLGAVISLDGYDYLWDSERWGYTESNTPRGRVGFEFMRDPDGSVLEITLDGETEFVKTIDEYVSEIISAWEEYGDELTYDNITFNETTDSLDIRIVITGAELFPGDKELEMGWIRFYVLVKVR